MSNPCFELLWIGTWLDAKITISTGIFPNQSTDTGRASLPTLAASANAVLPPNGHLHQVFKCHPQNYLHVVPLFLRFSHGKFLPHSVPVVRLETLTGAPARSMVSKHPCWTQQVHTNSQLSEFFHCNQIPASCAFLTQRLRADSPAVFANETDLKLQDLQSCEILI